MPEPLPVSSLHADSELADVITRAFALSRTKKGPRDVTFNGLLLAALTASNPWSAWATERARERGPDLAGIAKRNGIEPARLKESTDAANPAAQKSISLSPSAASVLDATHSLCREVHGPQQAGVRHLLGALIYRPAGHERDLKRLGFDQRSWGRAFVQRVRASHPTEAANWERIHSSAFGEAVPALTEDGSERRHTDDSNAGKSPVGDAGSRTRPPFGVAVDLELPFNDNSLRVLRTAVALARAALPKAPVGAAALLCAAIGRFAPPETFGFIAGRRLRQLARLADVEEALGEFGSAVRFMDPQVSSSGEPLVRELFDSEAQKILDRAISAARRTWLPADGKQRVAVRHLVAAMFTGDPGPGIREFLGQTRLGQARAARVLRDALLHGNDFEEGRGWEEVWGDLPAASEPRALPGYVPDHVPDELPATGIEAREVASDDQLGILDDVDALCSVIADVAVAPPLALGLFGGWGSGKSFFMRQMRAEISARGREAQAELAAGKKPQFCTNVAQVTFNAWHYMDANLWASLAHRIFEGLEQLGPGTRAPDLVDQLATAKAALTAAELQRKDADAKVEAAKKRVAEKESEKAGLVAQLGLVARIAVKTVSQSPRVREEIEKAAASLRRPGNIKPEDLAGEAKTIVQQLGGIRGVIRRQVRTWEMLYIVLAVLAVVLVGRVVASDRAVAIVQWLLGSPAVILILQRWRQARNAVEDAIRHLQLAQGIAQAEAEAQETQRVAAVQSDLQRVSVEAEQARSVEARFRGELQKLDVELAEIRDGKRLFSFVKTAGADYHGDLGTISRIRRHFEELTRLFEQRARANEGETYRFILYIDDLDRCPARRVVEVLQAVHLLLAFPLFVVVVGVDARWLIESLRRHDRGQLSDGDSDATWASRPMDYLEKIFQIPFVIRPMKSDGFGALMTKYAPNIAAVPVTTDDGEYIETDSGELVVAHGDPEDDVTPSAVRAPGTQADAKSNGLTTAPDRRRRTKIEISTAELAHMKRLGPLLGTPRAAKRFANVYRIVRTSAGQDGFGFEPQPAEIAAVQLLVAAACGHVTSAGRLFREIEHTRTVSWRDFTSSLLASGSRALNTQRRTYRAADSGARPRRVLKEIAPDEQSWTRLVQALITVTTKGGMEPSLSALREWVPRVRCFSFEEFRA